MYSQRLLPCDVTRVRSRSSLGSKEKKVHAPVNFNVYNSRDMHNPDPTHEHKFSHESAFGKIETEKKTKKRSCPRILQSGGALGRAKHASHSAIIVLHF